MIPGDSLRTRAARLWRTLWPVAVVAGAAITCDAPTNPGRRIGLVNVVPVFSANGLSHFAGLTVDQVRLIVVRPPADTLARVAIPFSADSQSVTARIPVEVTGTEMLSVTIELLSGPAVVFTGTQMVQAVQGAPDAGNATAVPVTFVGPGAQLASIVIQPRDSGTLFGATVPFRVTGLDSASNVVPQFYVSWSTSNPAHTINANGLFTAGNARGTVWVRAHTPTGVWDSTRITISPVATQLQLSSGNSQSGPAGTALPLPLTVRIVAADGGGVAGVPVTFAAASGGGSVTPATRATDSLGYAATSATLGATLGANSFTAAAAGFTTVTFAATATTQPGVPTSLAINAGNGQTASAGTAVPVLPSVIVRDGLNAPVAGVSVTFAVASGGGTLTGATTTTNASGIATVGSWTLGGTPGANSLTATVTGLTPVTFTATGSNPLPQILLSLPGNLVPVGGNSALAVKLTQPAPAGGLTVTVTSDSLNTITVASPGTISFAAGDTLKAIQLNGLAAGQTFVHATATGYQPAQILLAAIPNFITLQQGVTVLAGQSTTLGITLSAPAPAGGLAIALSSTDAAVLTVTTPVNIAAGQTTGSASIQGVAAGTAGIIATATGYAGGGAVVTVNGAATTLTLVSGGNQNATPGAQLPQPIVVKVSDALGNPVSGFAVSFAVATGGGSVGTPSTATNASGLASTTWTLGNVAGAQTITVTATGLTGSPMTVSANSGAVVATVVSPQLDTINSIGGTRSLAAQAKDAQGNNVAGSFTWVSRTPAVATVNGTGVVTGVTNGSTYVVATEAGGTKDSALIVVQQSLASINVLPGTRSIYLTRNFTFTATAVDGGGTPLPSQPSFTWSTTAPAVATVNASGLVQAIGLGQAQIRATSGTVTGVANISVITPITRIAVVVDTVGAFKTDTFTLTSLGLTRRYRAIAHDTLDAVMTGVTFTWSSSFPPVANVGTITGDTSTVTSALNGIIEIRATAQGFTSAPGAKLTVSQVLASIALTAPPSNPTATVGIGGSLSFNALGKDANNQPITGGSFTYASSATAVATVSGNVVTGVANGTSDITASSGAITSNPVTVTVGGGSVPAIISFGRDTLSVGRGSNQSFPILLSKPAGAPLTVNLAAPAYAHWSTASVTIPTGQTSVNATLIGDSAGTTTVTATDGSGLGYSPASAVTKVTANMRLTSSSYGILANDVVTTQVLLSDPSPAGGTYVTFSFSTPGIAAISPDPAFIPAGQLAADIQIRGVAPGTTNITPNAVGVNGAASSFTAYPPVLYPSTSFLRLGQGQFEPNYYVYTQINTNVPIPVTITSSDTNVIRPSPLLVTIPSNSNYAYFNVAAKGVGTATITLSSPGWTAQSAITAVATTPLVGVCCGGNLLTTSPISNVSVYAEDSVRNVHNRTNSLLVHLNSTDTTVLKVLDTLVTIQPGLYYNNSARVIPGGNGGTAYVIATASGHGRDSTLYTVTGPSLFFSWGGTSRLGAGQEDVNLYVYAQNNVTAPLVVTLVNPDSNVLGLPTTVTIAANTNYAYFTVRGKTPGSVTLTATAPGYSPVNGTYVVTTPRVVIQGGTQINNFGPPRGYYVYATDSLGNAHPRTTALALTLRSSDTTVVKTDTVATIPAGQYYTTTPPQLTPVGIGLARIVATAAGHGADSTTYTIVQPKLNFSFTSYQIGRRQHRAANEFYVYTPDSRAVTVPVTITQKRPTVDSLTTTAPVIPINLNYQYFTFYGLANGVDTLIATATGYEPDTAFIQVSSPRFTTGGLPGSTTTTNPPISVIVYATDSVGNAHYVSDTVVVAAVSSDTTVIRPTQAFFRILKDAYYGQPTVTIVGPGTASITYSDSAGTGYGPVTTNTMTVTGPSLTMGIGSTVLGMRQHGGTSSSYVYTPNAVTTPLVVNLVSTDTRVATVPASITIPINSNIAYFDVTAQDTVGTIQIQATATGYSAAAGNVQVTVPRFVVSTSSQLNTTSAPQPIYVYAADANGTAHYVNEDVAVTLTSSAPSVAAIDSSTVTIVNGGYYTNAPRWAPGIVGTAQLQASDPRAALYHYTTGAQTVSVITPSLNFGWGNTSLGIGQYFDSYVYTPDAAAAPITVNFTHTGTARTNTRVAGVPVSGLTIAAGNNVGNFRLEGTVAGTDTLVAAAVTPVHNPITAYTVVGQGTIDPLGNWPGTLKAGDSVLVTLYARDPATSPRYVLNATTWTFSSVANMEFRSGGVGAASVVITQVTIPADQYYVQFYLKALNANTTGTATISATNYQTYTNTVTITP